VTPKRPGWINRGADKIDHAWPFVIFALAGGGSVALQIVWSQISAKPVLIGRLNPGTRAILYGSLATSAAALLGLTIAAIAILLTLDDGRTKVAEMQKLSAWSILNKTLLAAATFLGVDLLVSTIALGVDSDHGANGYVEGLVLAVSVVAFCELAVGGLAFALVVLNLTRQD
jgi:hypothetical protein